MMGILSWIFSQSETNEAVIPAVAPRKELFKIYEIIYWKIMDGVDVDKPIKVDMLKAINSKPGKFLDQTSLPEIFEKHFSGKLIVWDEYERWYNIFKSQGRFPVLWHGFLERPNVDAIAVEEICEHILKIPEIKAILKGLSVKFQTNSKKEDLVKLLEKMPIHEIIPFIPEWEKKRGEYQNRKTKEVLYLLLRTISGKTTSTEAKERILSLRARWKLLFAGIDPVGDELARMCAKQNPDAVPPFFPGDGTCLVIDDKSL